MTTTNFAADRLRELTDQELKELVIRITGFSQMWVKKTFWRGQKATNGNLDAISYADLVNQAISKALEGNRKWNPEKCSLYTFLCGIIKSDISHLYDGPDHKNLLREYGAVSDEDGSTKSPSLIDGQASTTDGPKDAALKDESEEKVIEFYLTLDDDKDLQRLCDYLVDGKTPSEIATLMNVPPSEIYNARKRLKRRAEVFWDSQISKSSKKKR